jgi:hypothetical protein
MYVHSLLDPKQLYRLRGSISATVSCSECLHSKQDLQRVMLVRSMLCVLLLLVLWDLPCAWRRHVLVSPAPLHLSHPSCQHCRSTAGSVGPGGEFLNAEHHQKQAQHAHPSGSARFLCAAEAALALLPGAITPSGVLCC